MQEREQMMLERTQSLRLRAILYLPSSILAFLTLSASVALSANAAPASQPSSFYRDVRPVLMTNCNACHKPDKTKAELDMTSYAAGMKGGKHGKTVVPGKPVGSRLIEEISGD